MIDAAPLTVPSAPRQDGFVQHMEQMANIMLMGAAGRN
jgi:hypothetical protein